MSIQELETASGADVFVGQLSTTARYHVFSALMKSKYLRRPAPKAYTTEEVAHIEHMVTTGEGIMTEEELFKSLEAECRDSN
jgi:hypothetical protein